MHCKLVIRFPASCFPATNAGGRGSMYGWLNRTRFALLASISVSAMFAQRDLATLTGTVTDASGAVVAGAKVEIIEQDTGQVYELTTNNAGEFTRPALKPSTYNVAVTATGFKKAQENNIILTS